MKASALLALLLAACTAGGGLAENVTLIAPSDGADLVRQCSRAGPEGADQFFTPTPAEIAAAEDAASAVLTEARGKYAAFIAQDEAQGWTTPFDWPADRALYQRQYVGYVAGGKRMIYGNFLPARDDAPADAPLIVCDGGPTFFGVEYDIDHSAVVRIAFNGGLGGPFLTPIEP